MLGFTSSSMRMKIAASTIIVPLALGMAACDYEKSFTKTGDGEYYIKSDNKPFISSNYKVTCASEHTKQSGKENRILEYVINPSDQSDSSASGNATQQASVVVHNGVVQYFSAQNGDILVQQDTSKNQMRAAVENDGWRVAGTALYVDQKNPKNSKQVNVDAFIKCP